MKPSKIAGFLALLCILSAQPAYAATAADQCAAADLNKTFNPPLKDKAKYCACFLAAVSASPNLSNEVKAFYQKQFSTEAAFTGPNGQYIGLDEQAAKVYVASNKTNTPEQEKQVDEIEMTRLNCFTQN